MKLPDGETAMQLYGLPRAFLLFSFALSGIIMLLVAAFGDVFKEGGFAAFASRPYLALTMSAIYAGLFFSLKTSKFLLPNKTYIEAKVNKAISSVQSAPLIERTTSAGKKFLEDAEKKAELVREKTTKELETWRAKEREKEWFLSNLNNRSISAPIEVEVLGGVGWEDIQGKKRLLSLNSNSLFISDVANLTEVKFEFDAILDLEISGPGKTTSGGGFIGGGFGVEGAVKGMAVATALNLLTTRTDIKTIIHITSRGSELWLYTSKVEPEGARLNLSAAFLALKNRMAVAPPVDVADQLSKLVALRDAKNITDEEYERLKTKILN